MTVVNHGYLLMAALLALRWRMVVSDEEIVALACGWKDVAHLYDPDFGKERRCSSLNLTPGSSYTVHGVFRYEKLNRPPVLDVWINSEHIQRVNTSSGESFIRIALAPANSRLEYCVQLVSTETTESLVSTLELMNMSEWLSSPTCRYPTRSLSEMDETYRSQQSLPVLVLGALASLVILTTVTGLCVTRLFRSLYFPSAVKPQPPVKCEDSLQITVQPWSVKQYTLKELEEAIGSKIAEGGFGYVYRGALPGKQEVAIKVRSSTSSQGLREFTAELTLLSKIRHENLVPLLGYCTEGQQEMLVYPYMSNGTLQDRLYGEAAKRKPLDWQTRLSVALGAARGLNFLHTCGPRPIIHRDVKSSNILLDDSMNARVADFGFSRLAPDDDSLVSLEVRGTTGYLDPEYYMTQVLTTKSDVFSFGVVLLEIVSGREPLNLRHPRPEASLVEWVRQSVHEDNIQRIIDPALNGTYIPEAMWRVVEVAYLSVQPNAVRRPEMAAVIKELDDALVAENNASQYMLSMDSIGSFRRSTSLRLSSFPAPVSFDPSPAFSETLESPHPR